MNSGVRLVGALDDEEPLTAVFVVTYKDGAGIGRRIEIEAITEPHHVRREARKAIDRLHALQPGSIRIQQRRR